MRKYRRRPLFTTLCDVVIDRVGDVVVVRANRKIGAQNAPPGVMVMAFMIRHALSFVTLHEYSTRGVYDLQGRFICISVYPYKAMEYDPVNKRLGTIPYLIDRCGYGESFMDTRVAFQQAVANWDSRVSKWKWRTLPHVGSRR